MVVSNTQKALKGMSSQTVVTIALGVVEVVSFAIMSRLLSQHDFGYYAAISAITIVFSSFSETGIGSAIIQRKNIDAQYINNSFTLSFVFGLFISLLLIAFAVPLSRAVADCSMAVPLMLMSVTLISNCLTSVNTSIMYRRLEFLRVGMINLIALGITTIIAIVLALRGFGYYAILTKAILTSLIVLGLSWKMAKTKYKFALDKTTMRSIFGFSGWLMASVFFRNLAHQLDRLLMSHLISIQSLGAYNRPKDLITQISGKIAGIFDTALFPVLSQIQDDYGKMKNAYLRSVYLMNLASSILAIGFVVNASLMIRIFFGMEWSSILLVLQILSIAIIFNFEARLADCYLRSLGWTRQQFLFRIFEVVAKIGGLFIGFTWGIVGVAISVLATDALMVGVKHFYIAKRIEISFSDAVIAFVKSLQYTLIVLPCMFMLALVLPNTVTGEVLLVMGYIILVLILFLACPTLIGSIYKNYYYPYVLSIFLRKLKHN